MQLVRTWDSPTFHHLSRTGHLTWIYPGILGHEIVKELCGRPDEWSKIYTLSRSKKEDFGSRAQHVHVDLSTTAEDIAQELREIKADYVFFAAYLQMDSDEENTRVNGRFAVCIIKLDLMSSAHTKPPR